jgi:hypothetical protein
VYQWAGLVAWMRKEAVTSNFDLRHPGTLSLENISILKDNIKIDLGEMVCGRV